MDKSTGQKKVNFQGDMKLHASHLWMYSMLMKYFNFHYSAGEAFADTYVKPWCRIGPYVVGFLAGYILYKTDCKIKIPKV